MTIMTIKCKICGRTPDEIPEYINAAKEENTTPAKYIKMYEGTFNPREEDTHKMKHIVSFSGGKDSTAMLLMMIEKGMPVDDIIFADTGKEFPQMYEHINKVENFIGRKIIKLKSEKSFDYYMFEHQTSKGKYMDRLGHGWPTMRVRWCTSHLKIKTVNKYLQELKKSHEVIQYIGIAADEKKRAKDKKYPLIEWGMTESDCLNYCYNKGFDWEGLYKLFDRVSCWCCPLQSLRELENLYLYFPDLWERLKEMDKRAFNQFRADYSVEQLEQRFEKKLKNYSVSFFPIKRKEAEKK